MNPIDAELLLRLNAEFQRFLEHYEPLMGQVSDQLNHSRLRQKYRSLQWVLQALHKISLTTTRITKTLSPTAELPSLQVACGPVVLNDLQSPTAEDCKHVAALHRNISITQHFDLWLHMSHHSVTVRDLMLAGV